jgi:archaellum component FlaG (FlaF/FlaG flagellin family)
VFANIEYGSNKGGSDYLHITDCRSQVSSESFRFSLFLKNLNEPEFVFDANGTLHLKELGAFVPDTLMKNFEGTIGFQNFNISGNIRDLNDPATTMVNGSGIFTLKNVGFEAGEIKYENINGIINYNAKNLSVKDLTIKFLGTEATFNGKVTGLAAFATALAQRKPMNDLILDADGELKINKLNLSDLIKTFSKKEEKSKRQKLDIKNVFRMNGNLSIAIQQFIYNKMSFNDVKISLTMSPLHLRLNKFYTQTMGGTANGNGYFVFVGEKDLLMNFGIELSDIDITSVFSETENFGQSTLTAEQISGTTNAKVYLKNTWKNYEQIDEDNLNAIVDFEIKNGRLKNFEPVKAASKFIRVEELSDIKFSDIKNRISIYNKTVFIPPFEIKSNAVNLIFSGEHHFDNTVDYHFKINLRRLLANKFNKSGREQYIENDPYDGLNVYLTMSGNLSNPAIKYDKASAAAKIKDDWKKEKDVLKTLFSKEKTTKGEKREEKYFQIEEQPVFMDFEDDKP